MGVSFYTFASPSLSSLLLTALSLDSQVEEEEPVI